MMGHQDFLAWRDLWGQKDPRGQLEIKEKLALRALPDLQDLLERTL